MPTETERRLESIEGTLYGNGSEGLKTRMTKIEATMESLVEWRKEDKEERLWDRRWRKGILAAFIVTGGAACGGWLWNAAKAQAFGEIMVKMQRQVNEVANEVAPDAVMAE